MRVLVLVVVLAFAASGTARAEKVRANQPAKLLNHPGEQGKVLYKIKEGQNMTVIGQEGRWLKVRVGGRTGYVPRSKVEMSDNEELARNTRHRPFVGGRSTTRGFNSQAGPDDRVGADATGDNATADDTSDDGDKPKKGAKKSDDDEDKPKKGAKKSDDDEDKPKKGAKKSDDDEDKPKKGAKKSDDDEDKPKKGAKKSDDDEDKPKKGAKKSDDDEDKPKKGAHKKDDDDDKPKKGTHKKADDDVSTSDDDEDAKADDKAEDAPEEEKEPQRPSAHVSAKMKIYAERDKDSEVQFTAKPADVLYPTDTKGKWTMVETDEGDAGWVLTSDLDLDDSGGGGATVKKRIIDLNARLGVTFIQQGMRTTGSTLTGMDQVPDAYNIGTSAATISLGARLLFPFQKQYMLGGEADYDASKTLLGGVAYKATTAGLTVSDLNVRAVFAYPTKRKSGMTILGRLGFRYRGYLVSDYQDPAKNPAKIPQETLKAPTIGGALVIPMLTDKVGLQLGLDAILFGASITQTAGLEDGATPSVKAAHVNVGLVYRFKKEYNLCGAYDLDYAAYDFGAPNTGAAMQSTRGHTGTDVSRTDILHTISFGVQKLW